MFYYLVTRVCSHTFQVTHQTFAIHCKIHGATDLQQQRLPEASVHDIEVSKQKNKIKFRSKVITHPMHGLQQA